MENKAVAKAPKNAVQKTETAVIEYGAHSANLAQMLAEEMDGLTLSFDRIKIPSGGGLAYEVPSDNPDSPDMVKEFKAVILYHHTVHSFYKEKYTGGNTPPDCASRDGRTGVDSDGVVCDCTECPNNKFGSGENGSKACKQKRRIYILRAGEALPIILSLPTGSLADFSKYITRLLSKGQKSSAVVTKFSLKKAQNAGGISYSQAVLSVERSLTAEERGVIDRRAEQVKAIAHRIPEAAIAASDEESGNSGVWDGGRRTRRPDSQREDDMAEEKKRGRPVGSKNTPKPQEQKTYDKLTRAAVKVPSKRVYICSPLKGNVERNMARARIYCRFAFERGYVPVAPHIYFPQFLDDGDKYERAAGMRYGLEQLWQCREVWVFGENISDGMRAEIELARDLKIPVKYFDSDMVEK
jgi:hypothetical protein